MGSDQPPAPPGDKPASSGRGENDATAGELRRLNEALTRREREFRTLADITEQAAETAARQFGFASATADWRRIPEDPEIDVVNITAPNALHKEMALAAIAAGKHVYCEKPLAPTATDAAEMTAAAL